MQKVIPRCLSFRRLIIKITVSVFWRWDLAIYPCCCVVGGFFVCLFHFFSPTLPHFTRVEKCESYYGNRSEMIFCSHSARQIGVDVIHLGCRPCCKCIILPQPLSTHVCTQRFTFPGMGVSALQLAVGSLLGSAVCPCKVGASECLSWGAWEVKSCLVCSFPPSHVAPWKC